MKLIFVLVFCATLGFATKVTKSKKKGLVIPFWPQHFVGDFEAFDTVSWWYNYHSYKNVYQESPFWCRFHNGTVPKDKTGCFPSDPDVKFVPQVFGVPGYGNRPELEDDPPLPEWEWIFLAYNEPNRPDQANIPPKDCAIEYRALQVTLQFCKSSEKIQNYAKIIRVWMSGAQSAARIFMSAELSAGYF